MSARAARLEDAIALLGEHLLDGLASGALRALARRGLEAAGTIMRAVGGAVS